MARATKLDAEFMRRVSVDSQMRGEDEPFVALVCESRGWVKRDLHGCLYLTHDGERALAKYQAAHP